MYFLKEYVQVCNKNNCLCYTKGDKQSQQINFSAAFEFYDKIAKTRLAECVPVSDWYYFNLNRLMQRAKRIRRFLNKK